MHQVLPTLVFGEDADDRPALPMRHRGERKRAGGGTIQLEKTDEASVFDFDTDDRTHLTPIVIQ
jgi:hypothetical protein